ncbi:MAG TPA: PEPxxWA-CTERM sorting domain-containing protein [Sphingomonas sp.]|nr:PEPxxWA-CTERM sorting domain-containing protein [Sphingomonas sp.]HMI19422.1 PEPxxWA-CTERM sorting domain-containing protein [Sphingomonas sp.]
MNLLKAAALGFFAMLPVPAIAGSLLTVDVTDDIYANGGSGICRGGSDIVATRGPGVDVVPEPASWAMMVGGFGLIGGGMRSRRKAAFTFG